MQPFIQGFWSDSCHPLKLFSLEIAHSSLSLYEVPWAYMKFHELACRFMSLNAVPFFVWAAHKNFAVLVGLQKQNKINFFWDTLYYSYTNCLKDELRVRGGTIHCITIYGHDFECEFVNVIAVIFQVSVGQTWFSFGWESQLLETGFLAIWSVPLWSWRQMPSDLPSPKVSLEQNYLFSAKLKGVPTLKKVFQNQIQNVQLNGCKSLLMKSFLHSAHQ